MNTLREYIKAIQKASDKKTQLQYIREARRRLAQNSIRYTGPLELAWFHTIAITVCTLRSERLLHQRMLRQCNLEIKAFRKCIIAAHTAQTGNETHLITLEFDASGGAPASSYVTLRHGGH